MLNIILPASDTEMAVKLSFEHSLVSLSQWESIFNKPFYNIEPKTEEESEAYIKCMLLTEDVPSNFIKRFTKENFKEIENYINSSQSATTFNMEDDSKGYRETVTSELIYYWMVQFRIPFYPVEHWHLSRTMNLIKVAGVKQSKPKKMSRQQLAQQYRSMNEQRRRELGTNG